MSKPGISATAVEDLLKPVLLKDLRTACRARGLNPGGSRESLFERVKEHMLQTGNLSLVPDAADVSCAPAEGAAVREPLADAGVGVNNNNYSRPAGQNVGNFLTDRPSSRVLAPPGGGTSITLG